jgi:hypothetical protein
MGKPVASAQYTYSDVAVPASTERAPTHDEMTSLLRSIADAARPGEGCTKSLAGVVRVLRRCPWLDGELRMELAASGAMTTVHLFSEQGGVRERALPAVTMDVPLDEIEEALHHAPDLFAPLRMHHHKQRLVFTLGGNAATVPPPAIEVGAESMEHERPTVKRPAFVMPEAFRSGQHRRHGAKDEGEG